MAVLKYNATQLIESFRNAGMLGDSGATGAEDDDVLNLINEAVLLILLPKVKKLREEYFVKRERTALSTSTTRYRIPHRATLTSLRDLWYIDGNGDRRKLDLLPESDLDLYSEGSGYSEPCGFFLEENDVFLLPEGATLTGSLEFVYLMRPNQLADEDTCGIVSSVDTATKTITCTADVSSLFSAGDKIDVHSPYSGSELKCWSLTIDTVNTTDIVVLEDIDGTTYGTKAVAAGDYVCQEETCAILPLPRETHPLISRAAALLMAEALGDTEKFKLHEKILDKSLTELISAAEQRVQSKPMRLTGRRGVFGW